MAETVNLTADEATPTVSIDPGLNLPGVPMDVAQSRADKADYGLQGYMDANQWTKDTWLNHILTGREDNARQIAAQSVNNKNITDRLTGIANTPAPDIRNLGITQPQDPSSVIEDRFASRFTNGMDLLDPKWVTEIPQQYQAAKDLTKDLMSKQQDLQTWLEDNKQNASNVERLTVGALPLATSALFRTTAAELSGNPMAATGFLGNVVSAEAQRYWNMSKEDQRAYREAVVQKLGPTLGWDYLALMNGQSYTDKVMTSAYDLIDVATLGAVGKSLLEDLKSVSSGLIRAGAEAGIDRPIEAAQAAATGNQREAAIKQGASNITKIAVDPQPAEIYKQSMDSLTDNFRIANENLKAGGSGPYNPDILNRIMDANQNSALVIAKKASIIQRVNRTPYAQAAEDVVRAEEAKLEGQYSGLENQIVKINGPIRGELANTWNYETLIGDFDGNVWKSRQQAELNAEFNGFKNKNNGPFFTGVSVEEHGGGFVTRIETPWSEDSKALVGSVDKGLGVHEDTRYPGGWLTGLFRGRFASTGGTLSKAEMANRGITESTPNAWKTAVTQDLKTINAVPRSERTQFNQILNAGKDMFDDDGNKGRDFKTIPEFVDIWQKLWPNTFPSQRTVEAYFATRRAYMTDLTLRQRLAYTLANTWGAKRFRFSLSTGKNSLKKSDWIMGRRSDVNNLHLQGDWDQTVILGKDRQGSLVTRGRNMTKDTIEKIKKGELVHIELYQPQHFPMEDLVPKSKDTWVRYVVAPNGFDESSLDIGKMVPQREGGHFLYQSKYATVQPQWMRDKTTGKWIYLGDHTIALHDNPAWAREFTDQLDNARNLRGIGQPKKGLAAAQKMAVPEDKWNRWFEETRTPDGKVVKPYLNDYHPIRMVRLGETTMDNFSNPMLKDLETLHNLQHPGEKFAWEDGTRAGSGSIQAQVQFTQKRDAMDMFTPRRDGTKNNPLWSYRPTQFVDPVPTLQRGLNSIITSQQTEDMKRFSIMNWLKNARPHLRQDLQDMMWSAPWKVFNEITDSSWAKGSEHSNAVMQLSGIRRKIQNFSRIQDPTQRWLFKFATDTAQFIGAGGPISPIWAIPKLQDPFTIGRTFAIHPLLGLGKLSAYAMQLFTFGNVMSLGHYHAIPGFWGAALHEMTRLNTSKPWLNFLDKAASTIFGWRPGEWLEHSNYLRESSGFRTVGPDHSAWDDPESYLKTPNYIGGLGMIPFKEGAGQVKGASYFTAAHMMRNGGSPLRNNVFTSKIRGPFTEEQNFRLRDMAGALDHRMARSGNAEYQQGLGSWATLFWSYRLRLTEFLLDRQLNRAAKARLFLGSSAMWGLPAGGLGLVPLPVADWLRSAAVTGDWSVFGYNVFGQHEKYIPGDKWNIGGVQMDPVWAMALMEGGIGTLVAMITGADKTGKTIPGQLWSNTKDAYDWANEATKKGWHLNFSRFGNVSLLSDFLGDKSLWDLFKGAPGEIRNVWDRKAYPLMQDFLHWNDPDMNSKVMFNDAKEALRSIKSIDDLDVYLHALNTGRWDTQNNTIMAEDVSPAQATTMFATGTRPTEAIDSYALGRYGRQQEDTWKQQETNAVQFLNLYLKSCEAGECQEMYYKQAWAALDGYPDQKKDGVFHKAVEMYGRPVPDIIREREATKNLSSDDLEKLHQKDVDYQRYLNLQNERK